MRLIVGVIVAVLLLAVRAQSQVPEDIISLCKERWGSDYEMQLFCQKKQMAALDELHGSSNVNSDDSAIDQLTNRIVRIYTDKLIQIKKQSKMPDGNMGQRLANAMRLAKKQERPDFKPISDALASECHTRARQKLSPDVSEYCFALEYFNNKSDWLTLSPKGLWNEVILKRVEVNVLETMQELGASQKYSLDDIAVTLEKWIEASDDTYNAL